MISAKNTIFFIQQEIQIESSYFYKQECDEVPLALETFGVDTSAQRVVGRWWSFPLLWGWREWFFWQRGETLQWDAAITISLPLWVTDMMIWVIDLDRKYLLPAYLYEMIDEGWRTNMEFGMRENGDCAGRGIYTSLAGWPFIMSARGLCSQRIKINWLPCVILYVITV